MRDALEQKRPVTGSGTMQVTLLHNDARPHTAKNTLEVISNFGCEIFSYAVYSPDLVPSVPFLRGVFSRPRPFRLQVVIHLFRSLQHHLADSHSKSFDEVEKNIDEFIDSKRLSSEEDFSKITLKIR